jgi:hypothetical protein
VGSRTGLDVVAKRKIPFPSLPFPAENQTPVVKPMAISMFYLKLINSVTTRKYKKKMQMKNQGSINNNFQVQD